MQTTSRLCWSFSKDCIKYIRGGFIRRSAKKDRFPWLSVLLPEQSDNVATHLPAFQPTANVPTHRLQRQPSNIDVVFAQHLILMTFTYPSCFCITSLSKLYEKIFQPRCCTNAQRILIKIEWHKVKGAAQTIAALTSCYIRKCFWPKLC